jgi:hypothetical protein
MSFEEYPKLSCPSLLATVLTSISISAVLQFCSSLLSQIKFCSVHLDLLFFSHSVARFFPLSKMDGPQDTLDDSPSPSSYHAICNDSHRQSEPHPHRHSAPESARSSSPEYDSRSVTNPFASPRDDELDLGSASSSELGTSSYRHQSAGGILNLGSLPFENPTRQSEQDDEIRSVRSANSQPPPGRDLPRALQRQSAPALGIPSQASTHYARLRKPNPAHQQRPPSLAQMRKTTDWVKHPICDHCGSMTPRSGVTTIYGTPITDKRTFLDSADQQKAGPPICTLYS